MNLTHRIGGLLLPIAAFFVIVLNAIPLSAQTYTESFGQNRIQRRTFDWRYFDTEHFRVYHYDLAGRQLARYVAEQAEKDIRVIEQKMSGKFPKRFSIMLYNSYDEYLQSNVGRKYDSQLQDIPAGTVDLVGDRLVIYFTGVHTDVRRQLRAGMSRVVMERMLFGETLREMVKNAVLLNLPAWTTNGFIAYLVDGWDTQSETDWKNLLQANPDKGFYELAEKEPELAGKAFWKFVSENYGESTVKSLLYTMQLKSSLAEGIKMTLGSKIRDTYDSVINFYNQVYVKDAQVQQHPDSNQTAILEMPVPKDNTEIRNIRLSPRGFDVAYVEWKEGEFKVIIQYTQGDQEKATIVSGGAKDFNEQPDPQYPLLAWSNSGYKLAILYRKGPQTRLRIYNSIKAKLEDYIVPSNRFDRVLGMSFMEDDDNLVFSAIRKSKTDLYQFRVRGSRLTAITNDSWDDVQPWFVSGGSRRGVLFLSNRTAPHLNVPIQVNELPTGPMNIFFYDTKTKRPELLQVSNISDGSISQPIQYGSDHFAFLYDKNGIVNKYVVLFGRDQNNRDSAFALPVTNYTQSIISHQYNAASNQVAEVVQVADKYKVYFKPLQLPDTSQPPIQLQPTSLSVANPLNTPTILTPNTRLSPPEPTPVLQSGNIFQTEFSEDSNANSVVNDEIAPLEDQPEPVYTENDEDSILVDSTYVKMRAQPYRLSFKPDAFTIRMDNSILFNKYQSLDQNINQPLSGMITVSLDDVMEDHRFTGGIRLPADLSGLTYFLQYENFRRRIDWSILYFRSDRKSRVSIPFTDPNIPPLDAITMNVSNILQGSAIYPFDRRRSIGVHLALRQDVLHFKARDTFTLAHPQLQRQSTYWAMNRAEYVYDNTISPTLNIRYGLRYKFFAEYFYKLSSPNGGFYNFGLDVRNYQKIYRHIIAAGRVAFAHSAGNQRVKYVLGGVDNWIAPKQSSLPPPPGENFAFQSLATNLRGYEQNSRSGNTYGVINTELRVPILSSILRRPIQSAFLKNLQLVGFLDVGSAWNGFMPSTENTESYRFYNNAVHVGINPPDFAAAVGYGTGLRTMLFGYFMRLDAGWNIEGRKKPIWHFSIGTDF